MGLSYDQIWDAIRGSKPNDWLVHDEREELIFKGDLDVRIERTVEKR